YNADGRLYDSFFSVFVTGFIVSFGLVCQPHILMKALYLKSDRDVNRYLVIGAGIGFVFALMLLAGIYARVRFPELAAEGIGQDAVMVVYIQRAFPTVVGVLISVAILAAGMSTMDGILVSASTIAGNDLFLGALGKQLTKGRTDNERQRLALHASRGILIAMGVASLILALDPPEVVGLFAQLGIYGLVTASIGPVVFGVFVARSDARVAWLGAVVGPVVHFAHYGYVSWTSDAYFNPAVSATEGVVASLLVMAAATALVRTPAKEPKAQNGAFLA
ncbi:MAG: sodium:solute symporter family protein, partial [Myxococcota bacterium]